MRWRCGVLAPAVLLGACTSIQFDQRSLAGTDWRVTAINRRPTPADDRYHMEFIENRWRGGFGCNGMSSEYRLQNNQLTIGRMDGQRFIVGAVMATERDCADAPDGHFEGEAEAIFRQPMTMQPNGKRNLRLSNGAGSIELNLIRETI